MTSHEHPDGGLSSPPVRGRSTIGTWFELLVRSIRRGGLFHASLAIPIYITRQWRVRRFDRRYGTRTSDVRPIGQHEVVGMSVRHSSTHMATPWEFFRDMLKATPASPQELVFVDIGSGLGRAVLYASLLPFKRVIGIEFSRELHEGALRNVEIFRRRNPNMAPVELICADALTHELPQEDTLLYFAQPFDREMFTLMMQHVAESLAEAPRRLLLIYYEPRHREVVENSGLFTLLAAKGEPGDPSGAWCIWRTVPEKERGRS